MAKPKDQLIKMGNRRAQVEVEHPTKGDATILQMQLEMMSLIRGKKYETAHIVAEKLTLLDPNNPIVAEFRSVLQEKIDLDQLADEEGDEDEDEAESEGEEEEEDSDEEEDGEEQEDDKDVGEVAADNEEEDDVDYSIPAENDPTEPPKILPNAQMASTFKELLAEDEEETTLVTEELQRIQM
mmetsp:Transcript_13126/g.15883  ORF Transcript_13126/g.15883 Transcript_13126/m.15883 type:complete len:183 (-) Transcript_13126:493-1041(-)|eukprot:CAMPEP_0197848400 /NCGR_PEP_ID=MMETSP1438-20131217/8625_1 /TAXON_ID=1461541 /ORGANISM="Pterosperma sp., Strain CCMP1384" /LENGTH=182 /DNA_ID=CAMNT_0043460621 /DNA_START=41 /DNA_END=589 /DNA_ORIENTATION=+